MSTEDIILEQYRMVNLYLKRVINNDSDYDDVKFFIEEIQHKLTYILKLKRKTILKGGSKS